MRKRVGGTYQWPQNGIVHASLPIIGVGARVEDDLGVGVRVDEVGGEDACR